MGDADRTAGDEPVTTSEPRVPQGAVLELSVFVRCPPRTVFAALADIQDLEPQPVRERIRMVKEPPGPTRRGTRWHEAVRMLPGWWMRVESVATDVDEPVRLGLDYSSRWFTGHLDYTVVPAPGGCLVRQHETFRPRLLLRRLGPPLLVPRLRRHLEQRLVDLAATIERRTGQAPRAAGR